MNRDRDQDLLHAWQRGDTRAGDQLFLRYFKSIRRFFINKVAPGEEEDLIQTTFLACVKGAAGFRGDASFRTYLFQIADNVLNEHLRQRYKRGENMNFDEVSVAALQPGPSTIVGKNRQQELLVQALRKLSINHQKVLELYYWEDMSASEVGEVLGLVVGTVRSRLERAIDSLRHHLERLARSPQELSSTLDNLERWAAELRAEIDRMKPSTAADAHSPAPSPGP